MITENWHLPNPLCLFAPKRFIYDNASAISSDKSSDIIKALSKKLSKAKVDIKLNSKVTDVFFENNTIKSNA